MGMEAGRYPALRGLMSDGGRQVAFPTTTDCPLLLARSGGLGRAIGPQSVTLGRSVLGGAGTQAGRQRVQTELVIPHPAGPHKPHTTHHNPRTSLVNILGISPSTCVWGCTSCLGGAGVSVLAIFAFFSCHGRTRDAGQGFLYPAYAHVHRLILTAVARTQLQSTPVTGPLLCIPFTQRTGLS